MSTKYAGLLVTFESDVHEDHIAKFVELVTMINGVASAKPVESSIEVHIATERAQLEVRGKLVELLKSMR